ncbi:hypothetical protein Tco_0656444 [Tanacetum coccineum]|uniref:Integrase, catalytic region, zinc finger, CCHC-type, peptidase aspartic, catalytic n=1 Tax=Tanacetum coccineum TaxID=301880 RepID=A0ABQ4X9Z2_9ASTR
MLGEQLQLEIRELKTELAILILNGIVLDEEQLLFIAAGQTNTFDDDVDEAPVQDLALNEDNIFQADQCDAFDSDVDEAPTAQTMFMANLSSADLIYDEDGPSYDSDILSESDGKVILRNENSEVPHRYSAVKSLSCNTMICEAGFGCATARITVWELLFVGLHRSGSDFNVCEVEEDFFFRVVNNSEMEELTLNIGARYY